MKFTIFMSAWIIALALNPAVIQPKVTPFAVIAASLAFFDMIFNKS